MVEIGTTPIRKSWCRRGHRSLSFFAAGRDCRPARFVSEVLSDLFDLTLASPCVGIVPSSRSDEVQCCRGGRQAFAGAGVARCPASRLADLRVADSEGSGDRGEAVAEQEGGSARWAQPWLGVHGVGHGVGEVAFGQWFVVDHVVDAGFGGQDRCDGFGAVGDVDRGLVAVGGAEHHGDVPFGLGEHLFAVGGAGAVEQAEAQHDSGTA